MNRLHEIKASLSGLNARALLRTGLIAIALVAFATVAIPIAGGVAGHGDAPVVSAGECVDSDAPECQEATATPEDENKRDSSITICKSTDPASEGDQLDFDTDIPGMEDIDLADGDCMTQDKLKAGKYEITEDSRTNWTLVEIVCEGTDAENIKIELEKRTVIVDLQKGKDVTCTFFNEKEPTPTNTPVDTATPTDEPTNTPEDRATNTPFPTPTFVPTEQSPAMPTDMPEGPVALPDAGSWSGPDLVLSWYWYTLVGALLLVGLGVLIKPSYD